MRRRRPADAVISDLDDHTVMDARGSVRSIQAATVTTPEGELDAIWTATYLERLLTSTARVAPLTRGVR